MLNNSLRMMLNSRPLNPKSFLESRCNCLRMMLNISVTNVLVVEI